MPEDTTQQQAAATETTQATDRPQENVVAEERRKREKAEAEATELREQQQQVAQRLEELEDRDKSELERERKARERAEKDNSELTSRLTRLERGGWVRAAALDEKFHDPSDAVAQIDLSEVKSEKDAERAVKHLADRKKHLVNQEPERPQVGQVLQSGQPVVAGQEQAMTQEQQDLLERIRGASEQGWTSVPLS